MSFPGIQHFTHVVTTQKWRNLVLLCNSTVRGLLEAYMWFPLDCTDSTFSFADFALYPFTVNNRSHRHNHMVSLVSPPNKSPNLEVVLGIHDTIVNKCVYGDNSKFMSPEINFLLSFRLSIYIYLSGITPLGNLLATSDLAWSKQNS